jgi:hypothetical protein
MLNPGEYYVGDLCYVFNEETWEEVCELTLDENTCLEGVFQLKDGRIFSMFGTAYGDGEYRDQKGRVYLVDSGTIGCVLASDIDIGARVFGTDGGQVVKMSEPFSPYNQEGYLHFGTVSIDTAGYDESKYDEEEEEDALY